MHPPATARLAARLAAASGLALAVFLLPGRGAGQPPAPVLPTVPAPTGIPDVVQPAVPEKANGDKDQPAAVPELSLGECVAIAFERNPALKAVKASQNATEAGVRAINNIGKIGQVLSPDLPIRKEQAGKGVIAAAADMQKTHNEVVQDVTRLYYTVVYARQQEALTEDVVAQIELLVDIGRKLLKSPNPGDMTVQKLDAMEIGLAEARGLRLTARSGERQAMAALREVMGVTDVAFPFRVKDKELPLMEQKNPVTKDLVVGYALARRPELALAAAGVDAFRLEVYAQGRVPFRRAVPTLASGADIHAREVPMTNRGKDYRPGAIVPEMPPQLVGSKYDRVCRAMAYSQRAEAVFEKACNLIILEAETAFFDFETAAERVQINKSKYEFGKDLMDRTRENIENLKADKAQLVQSYSIAARAQADYVESVYQYLLALAALERITAGGVCPQFPGR